ncbi:inorganic phosphate transporter [Halosolutus gelatinilyticus]|uniref:inorganic phosphate transporter n=1 Tax=Halosolutus gelatinilyticus TaxID=2931975 RepID=UPI001FF5DF10|nr:inorganic phosphate transporter [Halosolutus gelatinilyticus]
MFDAVATIATFGAAGVASLFMAWTIGAGSSGSTPFAPAVGANAISVMRAAFVVGLLGLAGAVLQGANVTAAVGTELVRGVAFTPLSATLGLLVAATLVAVGVFAGYPIATAFTVTGAMVGVGLATGGTPAWGKYIQIGLLWTLTPFVGGATAYATARLLQSEAAADDRVLPGLAVVIGAIVANVGFVVFGPPGGTASLATAAGRALSLPETPANVAATASLAGAFALLVWRAAARDPVACKYRMLLGLGGLVAFSAGGSQVGLALGPIVPLLDAVDVSVSAALVGGGVGLLVGSWTGAPRMIKALSRDYSSLSAERSIAALFPAFIIAQTAVFFGIPVSFNEIIVSTIVGAGYAGRSGGTSASKMGRTVVAWALSLALALLCGYGLASLASAIA